MLSRKEVIVQRLVEIPDERAGLLAAVNDLFLRIDDIDDEKQSLSQEFLRLTEVKERA